MKKLVVLVVLAGVGAAAWRKFQGSRAEEDGQRDGDGAGGAHDVLLRDRDRLGAVECHDGRTRRSWITHSRPFLAPSLTGKAVLRGPQTLD